LEGPRWNTQRSRQKMRTLRKLYELLSQVVASRYGESLQAGALVRAHYLRWTLNPLLQRTTGTAFDAGCGRGAYVARLLAGQFPAWRFLGLDLRLSVPSNHPSNLSLCVGDLQQLPMSGPFDVIYSTDVLEHLENPRALLAEFARASKKGGALLLHVPSHEERHYLPGVDREHSWLGQPGPGDAHLWHGFKREELEQWIVGAGFDLIWSRHTFGAAVSVLKELFMLGEAHRVPGIGLALFPFLTMATWLEWRLGRGRCGNGLLILAQRG